LEELAKSNPDNVITQKLFKQVETIICAWISENTDLHFQLTKLQNICEVWPENNFDRFPTIRLALLELIDTCRKNDNFDNHLLDLQRKLKKNSQVLLEGIRTTAYEPRVKYQPEPDSFTSWHSIRVH